MTRKLAIKRLRSSDLSLFNTYLAKGLTKGKQKGFNLDKVVLEGAFFPSLTSVLITRPKKALLVDLFLDGPGLTGPESLARKIKIDAKNFRLNGEVINNPTWAPGKYDALAAGDLAVLEFVGQSEPSSVKVLLVSAADPADSQIHAALSAEFPQGSMRVLSTETLARIVSETNPAPSHPLRQWADDSLEDIAAGGSDAIERVNRRSAGRGLSLEELQDAKAAAELTGQRGEAAVNRFLSAGGLSGVESFEWTSSENAIAPYDFLLRVDGKLRYADVKSTSGPFENPIHLSMAEMRIACRETGEYDLFRVSRLSSGIPRLRIARNVGPSLRPLMLTLNALPGGVGVDSLSIRPDFFAFEDSEHEINESGEEDDD